MEHPDKYIKTTPPHSQSISTSEQERLAGGKNAKRFVLVLIVAACVATGAAIIYKVL